LASSGNTTLPEGLRDVPCRIYVKEKLKSLRFTLDSFIAIKVL